jgi:hypothetical protein
LFRNRGLVKVGPGERVYVLFDNSTSIDFADIADAFHHLRVQGVAGVVSVNREDGALIIDRKRLDKELAHNYG